MQRSEETIIQNSANTNEYDKNSLVDRFLFMKGVSVDKIDKKHIRTQRLDIDNLIMLIERASEYLRSSVNVPFERVLDIGCGDGLSGRVLMGRKLANFIVGIDRSHDMIVLAKTYCDNDTEHYEYIIKDASDLSDLGQFPLIIQNYMLCEAETVNQLSKILASIRKACSGAFVGLIPSPFFDMKNVNKLKKYGVKYESQQEVDGDKCYITFEHGTANEFTLIDYWYTADTYEKLFKQAGFNFFEWVPCQLDANATNEEKEYIGDLIDSGRNIGFVAMV